MMKRWFRNFFNSTFLSIIYSTKCLYCGNEVPISGKILCDVCGSLLNLLEYDERCPYCFGISHQQGCLMQKSNLYRVASALEYEGPAAALVKHLKYRGMYYLAEGLSSYLATQLLELKWPFPDIIVPVPQSSLQRLQRGYNHSGLLAKELSKIIQCPEQRLLKRYSGGLPQAVQNKEQRQNLDPTLFGWRRKVDLYNKIVLLVDDVMTTGATLRACADILQEGCPARIYGLTVCCSS